VANHHAERLREHAGATYEELDSQIALSFRPSKRDARKGVPTDPFNCSMARCVTRAFDAPAAVYRHITLILMPVDEATLRWNRKYNRRGRKLKVGDLVWMRFGNPQNLVNEITNLDNGAAFESKPMTLKPITLGNRVTRDKYTSTRALRNGATKRGETPKFKRHLDLRRAIF
jgi:hypothetical protein